MEGKNNRANPEEPRRDMVTVEISKNSLKLHISTQGQVKPLNKH